MSGPSSLWIMYGLMFGAVLAGLVWDSARWVRGSSAVGALVLAAAGAVGLYTAWTLPAEKVGSSLAAGGGFALAGGLIALLTAATVIAGDGSAAITKGQRVALMGLAAMGSGLAAQSLNLVVMALALETAAVCSYALVASARTNRSAEAAMKYFIQGAVASGLMVLGLAVLVGGFSPDGSYAALSQAATVGGTALLAGLLLVVVTLAFKAGAVPFHAWVADAYESAPPASAGALAGPVKLAAVSVLAILVSVTAAAGSGPNAVLGLLGADLFPLLCGLSILSVVVGSLAALRQRSYTRMLAWAGVAQVGYALLAIASGSAPVTLLFTATYAVATVGAFVSAEVVAVLRPGWDGSIEGMRGTGRSVPGFGLALVLILMSLAGIPPLVGFWGKLQVFQSAMAVASGLGGQGAAGLSWLYAAAVLVGIVGSVVSVGYYGTVLREIYADSPSHAEVPSPNSVRSLLVVLALAAVVVATGIAPLIVPFSVLVRGFVL